MPPRKDQPKNDRQDQILEYIKDVIQQRGYAPSVREICEALDIRSTSTVHGHLRRLENRGLLVRDPTKPRAIEVVGMVHNAVQIPLVGKVTAGYPITAIENIDEYLSFAPDYFCRDEEDCFALHVSGNSMINAGILSGDIIIAEKTPVAENGEIIVALIGDEATVKRFYKEDGHFRLQPENDEYEPIITDELVILGKVVALTRSYR